MTRQERWRLALFAVALVAAGAALSISNRPVVAMILLSISIIGIVFSVPPSSTLNLATRQALIDGLAVPVIFMFILFGLPWNRPHQVAISLSLLGLILTRLDVVVGESRFRGLETKFLATFDIAKSHAMIVHFAKHPTRGIPLKLEARRKGVTAEQLCQEAYKLPYPGPLALAFSYLEHWMLVPKMFVEVLIYGARQALKVSGGNSVLKFCGFLLLLAAGIIELTLRIS